VGDGHGRNIVIFSDGTGQRGGVLVDERRSNIYKLYRATRVAPDSCVDPAEQTAFYDPGLGTLPGGIDSPVAFARSIYNVASQATGMGITRNIVDCHAALIRLWRPGDRIFLFGFSRGAYTMRCLGGVLKLCGVPTTGRNGALLRRDAASSQRSAKEAVAVYNYTNSRPKRARTKRQEELLSHRALLAARFRATYGSGGEDGGNARPYFLSVFDTVASLSNPAAVILLSVLAVLGVAAISLLSVWLPGSYWHWFGGLTLALGAGALLANLASRFKSACGLPGVPWWRTVHLATARIKMYDTELDEKVQYARHALSIDEARASFDRVPWGVPGQWRHSDPAWFEQLWFAGNHSDVGGSYPRIWLDFETISDAIPRWADCWPYRQAAFQFSALIEADDGSITPHAFLSFDGDPRRACAEALACLATEGAVIAWNAEFERKRLIELAQDFPDLRVFLHSLADRTVDLLPVAKAHWYHRDQRGSWSIKAVLPTIAPDLSYDDLTVANGGDAQTAYRRAIRPETSESERREIARALLEYCERDTEAMMVIAQRLGGKG